MVNYTVVFDKCEQNIARRKYCWYNFFVQMYGRKKKIIGFTYRQSDNAFKGVGFMTKIFREEQPNFPPNKDELDWRLAEIESLINVAQINIEFIEATFQIMQDCDLITEDNVKFLCNAQACKNFNPNFKFPFNPAEGALRSVKNDGDVLDADGKQRFYHGEKRRIELLNRQRYLFSNDWYADYSSCTNKRAFYIRCRKMKLNAVSSPFLIEQPVWKVIVHSDWDFKTGVFAMDSKTKIFSKTFVKGLLIIDALQNTDRDNPKTAQEIIKEVDEKLYELFPDAFTKSEAEPTKTGLATISRHIHDMNLLPELYKIETCSDNKLGYYNASEGKEFVFTPAEFALIAIALYRTPSISTEETETIIKKFKNLIGITGDMFSYAIVDKQIKVWQGIRRKTYHEILPIISELLKAIIESKQVSFNLYARSARYKGEKIPLQTRKKQRKSAEEITDTFRVSPYFLAWEDDECYLIAYSHYPNYDSPEGQQLTHFKLSLIANLKILEDDIEKLRRMDFYARYAMESHPFYTDSATRDRLRAIEEKLKGDESSFKNFSLDRYMREHIYMVTNSAATIDVTIEFDEDFVETILSQLTLKQKIQPPVNNDKKWRTIMTIQDNDGLYQWLMRYSDKVTVLSPQKVKDKLQKKLKTALENLG